MGAYISERALSIDGRGAHPDVQVDDTPRPSPFDEGVSVANVTLEVLSQLINSCLIGLSLALACSALFRWQKSLRLYPIHQTSLVRLSPFLPSLPPLL